MLSQLTVFHSFGLAVAERGERIPPKFMPWAENLAGQLLESAESIHQVAGLQLVGALRLAPLYSRVAQIAASTSNAVDVRVAALQACVATTDPRRLGFLDAIVGNPHEVQPMRRAAALALSQVNNDESRGLLLARLLTAHRQLAADIATALAGSTAGAEMLLTAIADGKASPQLLRESAVHRLLEASQVPELEVRLKKLTSNLPPQDTLIAESILETRAAFRASTPDTVLGKEAFTKHCGVCHLLAGDGKKFGPDLDGIGVRGIDRLLEDMLDPSRNVDPEFRSTIVVTDSGLTYTGLALRDEGAVLLLVDPEGKELRIRHDEIDERRTSPLSPMPNALEKALTPEEFHHLLSFLLEATEPLKPAPDQ